MPEHAVSDHEIVAALRPTLHRVLVALINSGRSKDEAFDDVREALGQLEQVEE